MFPKNFEMVKSFGAEHVFDYHSPNCAADIRACAKNSLKFIFGVITTSATIELCYSAQWAALVDDTRR